MDTARLKAELHWQPSVSFEEGLRQTLQWYLDNDDWLQRVTSGAYREYYEHMYDNR